MTYPDFAATDFLRDHVDQILDFYAPHAFDPQGGFFHNFADDGTVYDQHNRHLVSSTRFVFNHVNGFFHSGDQRYRDWAEHGLHYLRTHHRLATGHYLWQRCGNKVVDGRAMAYGHAFVMLAAAWAARLEINPARQMIGESWDFLEHYFYAPEQVAYADERDQSLAVLDCYRGQNANMHAVEALLAAFETTKEARYLERAEAVAHQFCVIHAANNAHGQIWEHYDQHWKPDWQYNIDKPDDLFKPWGFQPGHQAEWSKLLLQIDQHLAADWHLSRARALFDGAMALGWDRQFGGLVYGYAPDGTFADARKYFWVHAEAIAAAYRLYVRTGEEGYRRDYQRLWRWSWDHLIDHRYGGWYRVVGRDGAWLGPQKSPMGKVDYHTLGACWDILAVQSA